MATDFGELASRDARSRDARSRTPGTTFARRCCAITATVLWIGAKR